MIKKIGLVFIGLLLMITEGEAQLRYVVPGGAGNMNGSSWENAMTGIKEAIGSGGKEILVRWGTYRLTEELVIGAGVKVLGGYASDGERQGGGTEMTVLQAVGKFRVARVKGILDGFTVCSGIAAGENGGGVYVETGGTVQNCIIRNNYAGRYYPRVGDVQLKDGSFMRMEELVKADEPRVKGIVFWINPDPDAVEGNRGWLVAKDPAVYFEKWAGSPADKRLVTGVGFADWKDALEDTMGWSHCQQVKKDHLLSYVPSIAACMNYDAGGVVAEKGKWYLPALGQLKYIVSEYAVLEKTWRKLYPDFGGMLFINGYPCYSSSEVGAGEEGYVWGVVFTDMDKWGIVSKQNKATMGSMYGSIPVTSF